MCGIVGVVSRKHNGFTVKHMDWFWDALRVDSVRGTDATGVAAINPNKDYEILKTASYPDNFFRLPEYESFRSKAYNTCKILIGHNRKATTSAPGSKTDPNCAHPFERGHIILVHNGWIFESGKIDPACKVDSEAIAKVLSETDDLEKAFAQLHGAMAVVWYNTKNHTINWVRNSERPMCLAIHDDQILFASESGMMQWLAWRNGIENLGEMKLLPTGEVWSWSMKEKKMTKTPVKFKEWVSQAAVKTTGTVDVSGLNDDDAAAWQDYCALPQDRVTPPKDTTVKPSKELQSLMDEQAILSDYYSHSDGFFATPTSVQAVTGNGAGYLLHMRVPVRPAVGGAQGSALSAWHIRATKWFLNKEDALRWVDRPRVWCMPGNGNSAVYGDKTFTITVGSIILPQSDQTARTYNSMKRTLADWAKLFQGRVCTECNNEFQWLRDLEYMILGNDKKKPGEPYIVCPQCAADKFSKMSDQQKINMLALNKVDPREWKQHVSSSTPTTSNPKAASS